MAGALTAIDPVRKGEPVIIAGTGWGATDVTVSISPGPLQEVVLAPATGAITTDGVIVWAPDQLGPYTITADDGSDTDSIELEVWSS